MYQKLQTQYPCLKKNQYGTIVLFTAPNTGTKLTKPTKKMPPYMRNNPIGTYLYVGWPEQDFITYNEPVILQN